MRTPDRFERAVLKVSKGPPHYKTVLFIEAVKLLRRKHIAVVRLVKRRRNQPALRRHADNPNIRAYRLACDEILADLAQWKRGTPCRLRSIK